jgi:acyl-CoA reductase-like NAD-dependent aldehyde dehydrogenase
MTACAGRETPLQGQASLLGGRAGSLVDGEITESTGPRIALTDPATGAVLLDYAAADASTAAACAGAARVQREWMALPAASGRSAP